jgi:hypothetical protein
VRELGAASTVLLKNKNSALPLGEHTGKAAERSLVLIGSDAGPGRMGPNEFSDQGGAITGTLAMGWGSGTANFTYLISVSGVLLSTFEAKLTTRKFCCSPSKRSNVGQERTGRVFRGCWMIMICLVRVISHTRNRLLWCS